MAKLKLPEYLPISPLAVLCPQCYAIPNEVCETASGGRLEIVHVARLKAAAKLGTARKTRKN